MAREARGDKASDQGDSKVARHKSLSSGTDAISPDGPGLVAHQLFSFVGLSVNIRIRSNLARASRSHQLSWRYLLNLAPTLSYQLSRQVLSAEAARVLEELQREGVALSSVDGLLGFDSNFQELQSEVERVEASRRTELEAARAAATGNGRVGQKAFNVELLGEYPLLQPDHVFARFALQSGLLQVANSYFGMYTRLRYYNVWHTLATTGEPRQSQLWHRDREDFKILKVFVYLSDVDEGAGALTYAKGSQRSGVIKRDPEFFVEGGVKRSKDEQMAAVVPPERWMQATGPKGTIVFADTSGYHKGGLAREHDRLMYVCMFTSPSSQSKELFRRCGEPARSADKALTFALSKPGDRN
jgi:hypothetical protein